MAIWNEHMRKNPIVFELQLSSNLISFIEENWKRIFVNNLEDEWIIHITNLWVEGQVGREAMLDSMRIYNALVANKNFGNT
jgi:hypothetical protein